MPETVESYGPSIDRAGELPWEEKHEVAEEAINKLGGRVRHCFRNAFVHLRRSWRLHPIDSEMSLFRAITAEEEAATALLLALKQRKYPGAEKLKPWEHAHKAAASPFLDAVGNLLADTGVPPPRLLINRGKRPMLSLSVNVAALTGAASPSFAVVDHPFNYVLTVGDEKSAHMFDAQLQELATSRNETSIQKLVQNEANLRNMLLYASDGGIPEVSFNDSLILKKRDRVYRLAMLTIGILQTKQHQLFATQCLRAYLAILGHSLSDHIDVQKLKTPQGHHMTIAQQPDGTYVQSSGYRVTSDAKISASWLRETRVAFSPK
ncbi:hypothetical protein [Rhizobium sp. L245/93]|uniref:hypothetical protein n=1 Tax=Rhizobium sp. L245/93 TaxID=2819998 RepID=UPI001ADD417F|nr:hypothetical protein [Rhizobium sp. L245/93]MBO9168420.1 hypothetical protein [Rhizobium sp. L245/93]